MNYILTESSLVYIFFAQHFYFYPHDNSSWMMNIYTHCRDHVPLRTKRSQIREGHENSKCKSEFTIKLLICKPLSSNFLICGFAEREEH